MTHKSNSYYFKNSFQGHYATALALREQGKKLTARDMEKEASNTYSKCIQEFKKGYEMSKKKKHDWILDAIATAVDLGT